MWKKLKKFYRKGSFFLIFFAIFILVLCSSSFAKDKINLDLIGRWGNSSSINCVKIQPQDNLTYAYCGTQNGFIILDITDPSTPREVIFLEIGQVEDLVFYQSASIKYAVLAVGEKGLVIIDITDPSIPIYVSKYDMSKGSKSVAISGHYAFVANVYKGLVIIDISDPSNPIFAGGYNISGEAVCVTLSGHYAFIVDWYNGLVIIDISDPSNPTYVGEYDTPGYAFDVSILGNYAFVLDWYKGLIIIDISDPFHPIYVGEYDTGDARDVAILGNYAFIVDNLRGLFIVDISNPSYPTYVGGYKSLWKASEVAISGNHVFIAGSFSGLIIIDISDPTDPSEVGKYFTPGEPQLLALSDNYAYVIAGIGNLVIIDISDPSHPIYMGVFKTNCFVNDLAISDNYAFLACGEKGLVIIDISDPYQPYCIAQINTSRITLDVTISGNYAFLADGWNGLVILDITNPSKPKNISEYNTSGEASVVTISGNLALVGGTSLDIIDISDPYQPILIGKYDNSETIYDLVISGDYIFLACGEKGLAIINITNPAQPSYIGQYYYEDFYASKIAISDNYAYIAGRPKGLEIIDISDPTNPTNAGLYLGNIYSVVISDTYAFLADKYEGLVIIDISILPQPNYIGGFNTYGNALGVTISGNYAFVVDERNGLIIIDISNPSKPTNVADYQGVNNIVISDTYAFLAANEDGMIILNISDPSHLINIGKHDTSGYVKDIAILENFAFLADQENGLVIIDISNPALPTYIGECGTPGTSHKITVSGDYAFLVDNRGRLDIIDISDPYLPTYVREYDTPGWVEDITIFGKYAFVADGLNGLVIIDISDLSHLNYVGGYDTPGRANGLAILNNYAFVTDGFGLVIIDISDLSQPTHAGGYDLFDSLGTVNGVAISNHYAFVANGHEGLVIIEISEPTGPAFTGKYHPLGNAYDIAILNDYAFVADGDGIVSIDMSDQSRPTLVGRYNSQWGTRNMTISGDFAFMADGDNGLVIIDISNPAYPTYTGNYPIGNIQNVTVSGNYAFVTFPSFYSEYFLHIIDISNPSKPTYTGKYKISKKILDVGISDNYAFLANSENGLVIIDISDPANPTYIGGYNTPGETQGVTISGSLAFVADGDNGLVIIDISDPVCPTYIGGYNTPGNAQDVTISGNSAFVADGDSGLMIIDISNSAYPNYIGGYNTPGNAQGIAISGSFAFVADGDSGLSVFKIIDIPPQQGNLLFCPSGPATAINPLWPSSQTLSNHAYSIFLSQTYTHYFTYYFTPCSYQDINGDGIIDPFTVDDFDPTIADITRSLTDWAYNRLNTGPLYLYLTGLGTDNIFQIFPGQNLKSIDSLDPNTSLKHCLDTFQQGTNRDIICLFEFASSGSFCDDLIDPNTPPYARTIITCTDSSTSYLDQTGMKSFTGHLLPLLQAETQDLLFVTDPNLSTAERQILYHDRAKHLQELFSQARKTFWSQEEPFTSQAPQMVTSQGPHTLTHLTLNINLLSSTIPDPNTLTIRAPNDIITLTATGHYLDGNIPLNPEKLHFQSSDEDILLVSKEGIITPNPTTQFNGKATILATIIDPDFTQSPDHDPTIPLGGVTGRITISVDISEEEFPEWQEKEGLPRAIIVAGKQNQTDTIWEEINTISQYAYQTLLSRGYSRTRIQFLTHLKEELAKDPNSPYTTDLDGDNDPNNDIDGIPTLENLEKAIKWGAEKGTKSLTLFLVDHGEKEGGFYLNPHEMLTPDILDTWLDKIQWSEELQKAHPIQVNVVIESCYSGAFIETLQATDSQKRIIITSTDPYEKSYLYARGLVSFSYYLFTYLQSGATFASAYDSALSSMLDIDRFLHQNREYLNEPHQRPQLDNRSLAKTVSLGEDFLISQDQPIITYAQILPDPNILIKQEITIKARPSDLDGIEEAWALVNATYAPPVFSGNPEQPVVDLPRIELSDANTPLEGIYEATYADFPYEGTYSILVFAKDKKGNVSLPYTLSVNVRGDTKTKALLVTGWVPDVSLQGLLDHAQWVLAQRQVAPPEILIQPDPDTFKNKLSEVSRDTDVLFLYLIGDTEIINGETRFILNEEKTLDPDTLDQWLDTLPGKKIVLIDTPRADDFIKISPNRIYIAGASSDTVPFFSHTGHCAFSQFFFTCIYRGASIYQAWEFSCDAVRYYYCDQAPRLEDRGSSGDLWNRLAKATYLGSPFVLRTAGPRITVPQDKTNVWGLEILWAETNESDPKIWVLIKTPRRGTIPKTLLPANDRYETQFDFDTPGAYIVTTYVEDPNGLLDYNKTTYTAVSPEPFPFYLDSDGDGYGDPNVYPSYYDPGPDYVLSTGDCDDTDAHSYPGAQEYYDGRDNNCDGYADEIFYFACEIFAMEDPNGIGSTDSVFIGLGPYAFEPKGEPWDANMVRMYIVEDPNDPNSPIADLQVFETSPEVFRWHLAIERGMMDVYPQIQWDTNDLGLGYFQLQRSWNKDEEILVWDMKKTTSYQANQEDGNELLRFSVIWSYEKPTKPKYLPRDSYPLLQFPVFYPSYPFYNNHTYVTYLLHCLNVEQVYTQWDWIKIDWWNPYLNKRIWGGNSNTGILAEWYDKLYGKSYQWYGFTNNLSNMFIRSNWESYLIPQGNIFSFGYPQSYYYPVFTNSGFSKWPFSYYHDY